MSRALAGKSAVVTGSTSGIGKAIAETFAREGANVMLNGFGDAGEIEAFRTGLERSARIQAAYHGADMTKPAEIADLVRKAEETFGAVDILVNNAGIQHVAPVDEFPLDKWDAIIAIDLSAAFHATRAALPGMKKRKWGRVVNIASIHGLIASPYKSAYVAAKHGLVGFTKAAALEVAQAGITVNAICPAYAMTAIIEKQVADQARITGVAPENVVRDVILVDQPTKKLIKVDHLAALVLYLASDAAESITGAALAIDGGWTAR
jgi:3-hydroxybutyrate dehydrogenase